MQLDRTYQKQLLEELAITYPNLVDFKDRFDDVDGVAPVTQDTRTPLG
ncbi:hypothetical protein UA18_00387 [Burkholderia multivorans]|uniref:Uncharacterized protein n=1 Tax=Burkholderia multivorans TaxID=87883 RepID=A0ABD7LHG9_9BURK|nr:hypothetical protein [Burkholderia multivorans]SAK12307.1 hypothetical protein UA18_00387 [Burkholderia multivorans]